MTKAELDLHLNHTRRLLQEIKDLGDRLMEDKSDDATNIRGSYEHVRKELRFLLSREYDVENRRLKY